MKLATLKRKWPEVILGLEVVAYSAIFSYLTVQKLLAFGMYAWDMGAYNQAFSTTLHGDLFYSTVVLPDTATLVVKGTMLAIHFAPILFAILPFYALFPSPITLLVMQSTILSFGAIPVYLLAKKELGSPLLALGFSTSYLLSPALMGINWYDFHPHAFFATFILFTLLFLERKKVGLCSIFLLLSLFTVEIAVYFGLAIGIVTLWIYRKPFLEMLKKHKATALLKFAPVTVILISLIWLIVSYLAMIALGGYGAFASSALLRRFTMLGAKTTPEIASQIFLNPLSVIRALSFDWQAKVFFLLIIFGSFAFLSLLDIPRFSLASIWAALVLLSNFPPFYQIGDQYSVFVLPFVAYSAIYGMKKLYKLTHDAVMRSRLLSTHRVSSRTLVSVVLSSIILCSTLAFIYLASPLGPLFSVNYLGASPFIIPVISQREKALNEIISLVPHNSSILTQNDLFVQFSDRKNAYPFPFSNTFVNPTDFYVWLDAYFQYADFVLVDAQDQVSSTLAFSKTSMSKDFGIYAAVDGIVLFKKGYQDQPPVLFEPYRRIFTYSDLQIQMGSVVSDASSLTGKVIYHNSSLGYPSDFWYGPGVFLLPGNYSVNFRLKVSSDSSDYIMALGVEAWPIILEYQMEGWKGAGFIPTISVKSGPRETIVTRQVKEGDFAGSDDYQTVALHFEVTKPAGFEFVGLSVKDGVGVYLDNIELLQLGA